MRRIIHSILLAGLCLAMSCTKDTTSDQDAISSGPTFAVGATIACLQPDTRLEVDDSYRLSWTEGDAIGIFQKTGITILNTRAQYDAASGRFIAVGEASVAGRMSAYYPYRKYASTSTSDTDVWVSLNQGQNQSAVGKFEAVRYLTMSATAEMVKGRETVLEMQPIGAVLEMDIYDSKSAYAGESVKRITVTDVDSLPLCGGYKYDISKTPAEPDYSSSLVRRAVSVRMDSPFKVGSTKGTGKVYAAVLPGSHRLRIAVETTMYTHVFTFSSATECASGHVVHLPLNLSSGDACLKHYVLYQPFDLMVWGTNDLVGSCQGKFGYSLSKSDEYPSAADTDPECPYAYPNTKYTYGTTSWSEGVFGDDYIRSRGMEGYSCTICCEMEGSFRIGTKSNFGNLITPQLAPLSVGGNALLNFDATGHDDDSELTLSILGGGTFSDGTTKCVLGCASGSLPKALSGQVGHYGYAVLNATASTQIKFETTSAKYRVHIDNISVTNGYVEQCPPVSDIEYTSTTSSVTASWPAVAAASSYNYFIRNAAGTTLGSGTTQSTSFTASMLSPGSHYSVGVQAVSSNPMVLPSEYRTESARTGIDTHGGYILFRDNLDWIDRMMPQYSSVGFSVESWVSRSPVGSDVDPAIRTDHVNTGYMTQHGVDMFNQAGYYAPLSGSYCYTYLKYREIKLGRTYSNAGSAGSVTLPAAATASVVGTENVDLRLYVGRYSTSESGVLFVETRTGTSTETQRVDLRPYAACYYHVLHLDNVTKDTSIRLYAPVMQVGMSNRVCIREIGVYRRQTLTEPLANDSHVAAHRCANAESGSPANSIASLHYCMYAGCAGIECDTQITSDGVLFMWHPNSKGQVFGMVPYEHTWAEMYAAGTHANGERLMTLGEFIDEALIAGLDSKLLVDIKTVNNPAETPHPDVSERIGNAVIDVIVSKGVEKYCELNVSCGLTVGKALLPKAHQHNIPVIMVGGGNTAASLKTMGFDAGSNSLTTAMSGHGGKGSRTIDEFNKAGVPLVVYSLDKYYFNSASLYMYPSEGHTDDSIDNVSYYLQNIRKIRMIMSNYPLWVRECTQ